MHSYDPTAETVTLTLSEYHDLVCDASFYRYLVNGGVDNWDGYEVALKDYFNGATPMTNWEADLFALELMRDEECNDYALSVAYEWLQARCKPHLASPERLADLRDELQAIQKVVGAD